MKLTELQLQKFCKSPDPKIKVFLAFGTDDGAIREAFIKVSKAIVPDLNDAFRVTNLDVAMFKGSPSLLFDEASVVSLLDERRLIRINGADERVVPSLSLFLDNYNGNSFVVIAAGDLTKTAKLRKMAETNEKIAYYIAGEPNKDVLINLITADLKEAGKEADYDTIAWIADNTGLDRALMRSEIQKLITFAGTESKITLEIAQNIVGDTSAVSKGDFVYALASGNFAQMDRLLNRLFKEDDNAAVSLVRTAIYHFQKLHIALAQIATGIPAEEAIRSIYPIIPYNKKSEFLSQLHHWSQANVERVLRYLVDVEIGCKSTGNIPETLCSNAFLNICNLCNINRR